MSRARDLASSGVTSTVLSEKAPLASPDFTGSVDLTGTEAIIKLTDSAVTGEGFIDFDGSSLQLNTHRNPNTGANSNSKAPASIILSGNNADSSVKFYTKASNSGAATERMGIDKDGSITTANGQFNGTIGTSASQPRGYLNYISQKTISGVREFDVTNGSDGFVIDTTYTHYLIKLSNMGNSGTSNVTRVFVGTSSAFRTSGYWTIITRGLYNGSTLQEASEGRIDCLCGSRYDLGGQNQGADMELLLINPASTSIYTTGEFRVRNTDNSYAGWSESCGRYRDSTEAHDRVRFYSPSSGTQMSATVTLFGIKYVG